MCGIAVVGTSNNLVSPFNWDSFCSIFSLMSNASRPSFVSLSFYLVIKTRNDPYTTTATCSDSLMRNYY